MLFKKFNCDTIYHIKKDKKNEKAKLQAIIFKDNKLVVMYREKAGRVYFTFPGGGQNKAKRSQTVLFENAKKNLELTLSQSNKFTHTKTKKHFNTFFCASGLMASLAQAKAKSLKLLEQTFTFQVLCLLTKCKISH